MRTSLVVFGVIVVLLADVYGLTFYVVRSGTGRVEFQHLIIDKKGMQNPAGAKVIERGGAFGWEATVRATTAPQWTVELTAPVVRDSWDTADLVSVTEDKTVGRYANYFAPVPTSLFSDMRSFLDKICFVNRYTAKQILSVAPDEPAGMFALTATANGTVLSLRLLLDDQRPQ